MRIAILRCPPSPPSRSRALSLLALSALLLGSAAAAAAPATVGAVDKAQGQVEASQAGVPRDLAVAAPVLFGDRLRTGPAARLEAKLADGTVLTLGEKGRLTVDKFVYDPDRDGGRLALTVKSGAFLFVGGRIEGPTGGHVDIHTPVGTLGVRGTTVWGGHIDGGFGVLVLSGEVSLKTPRGTVTMRKGQGTMVYDGKAPSGAAPWPDDRVNRAVATISFDPATASEPAASEPLTFDRLLHDVLPAR
ncbi:FecR family protein [Lichenibacterium ramalinae]|uniref:FecR protein domain-containing protein n=1 Tax=Lichenibacterium ramalinae TaxID=2316527 RepID=A0A4Q2R5T6_9HYPH|nr:FecR family protein [Lichenibacterium ramalinae]RYB01926.1 hypothetical protein D3272_23820 [Lichenibacterium ramalinae]